MGSLHCQLSLLCSVPWIMTGYTAGPCGWWLRLLDPCFLTQLITFRVWRKVENASLFCSTFLRSAVAGGFWEWRCVFHLRCVRPSLRPQDDAYRKLPGFFSLCGRRRILGFFSYLVLFFFGKKKREINLYQNISSARSRKWAVLGIGKPIFRGKFCHLFYDLNVLVRFPHL